MWSGVRGLLEVAWRGVHRHGRLKHRGFVTLVCFGISSFYCLLKMYQTNRNNVTILQASRKPKYKVLMYCECALRGRSTHLQGHAQ